MTRRRMILNWLAGGYPVRDGQNRMVGYYQLKITDC